MDAAQIEDMYNQFNNYLFQHFNFFWFVILGVFAIISFALYFVARSMVQSGINKEISEIKSQLEKAEKSLSEKDAEMSNRIIKIESYNEYIGPVDLPLFDGVIGFVKYSKINNVVYMDGVIDLSIPDATKGNISLLPYGFRPSYKVNEILSTFGDIKALITIDTDGKIFVSTIASKDELDKLDALSIKIIINLSFPAMRTVQKN